MKTIPAWLQRARDAWRAQPPVSTGSDGGDGSVTTLTTARGHGLEMGDVMEINFCDGRPPIKVRLASAQTASTVRVRPPRWYDRIALWIWRHARWLAR